MLRSELNNAHADEVDRDPADEGNDDDGGLERHGRRRHDPHDEELVQCGLLRRQVRRDLSLVQRRVLIDAGGDLRQLDKLVLVSVVYL